jgi:hypothetical protein
MGIGTFNLFYPCSTYSGNVANMSIRKKAQNSPAGCGATPLIWTRQDSWLTPVVRS